MEPTNQEKTVPICMLRVNVIPLWILPCMLDLRDPSIEQRLPAARGN
ncbi:MAG: hypothetical protein QF408_12590 [Pirellulales bacterium]|nr:hypothetical protein [Pirellulales bacterium]